MNNFMDTYIKSLQAGFNKRAAETYLPTQKKPKDLKAKDMLDMDSTRGALSDIFTPISHGGYRAGKAEVMARSTRQDPGFVVTNPITSNILASLGGGFAGGVLGGGIGAAVTSSDDTGSGIAAGSVVGTYAGAIAGAVLNGLARRKRMKSISKGFDSSEEVTPYARRGNPLALMAGSHESGRADALGEVVGRRAPEGTPTSNKVTTTMNLIDVTGGVGTMASSMYEKHRGRKKTKEILMERLGFAPTHMGLSSRSVPIPAAQGRG